ncbi:N-acetylmuramoyl-L-alanine amidase [Alkalilimnicola ehrlichii]|uniref:1,6-anhydro-N-acetylmuramyl-L-alanine amidase AmpD n=1 Tax=Alkalilimnicola ehrlichii TaxID=351052 RepID=A0A3E0X1U7_9GAMM|nr:1,6-anhydro-N-acetylmuramyl-L-alanine amidase AmpD [Alkalilimnicola ehrlichii]RFA31267.1 N-acetylmuramoyl-L-alanine amidase [Alkalilimnicola ehrlichii]RFA39457.1 N-acetylmuramoyl-L-alanine amidase [Alkalilimnicola ehrlichii]
MIDLKTGQVAAARQRPSPNYDERPENIAIDLLVIHNISLPPNEFGGPYIDALFTNALDCELHPFFDQLRGLKVSAHLLIRRDGELLQYVPLHKRAWHAGVSCFDGRERCNDFSIGIELEGCDDQRFTEAQYGCLLPLCSALMDAYPGITPERIVGHSDIAPGRKTDPGPHFDWNRLRTVLSSVS